MKAIWIFLIAGFLAVPMAACAQDESGGAPAQPETAAEQTAANDAPAEQAPAPARQAPTRQYPAGEYYTVIQPAQPTDHPGKIEVIEVFSYACPHCYAFEPYIAAWAESTPEDVVFVRLPAIFNAIYENYARAYYTAQALGVVEETHQALFDAIHKENRRFRSQEDLAGFYSNYGVDPETYLSTAQSFAVETQLNRAQVLAPRYGITGVPTIIVNGQYRVQAGGPIGSYEEMLDVVNYLIRMERQAQGG